MSRVSQGLYFEVEFSRSFQMVLDWAEERGVDWDHPAIPLRWHKIADTSTLRYAQCSQCNTFAKRCTRCGAQLSRKSHAPATEGDWRIYWERVMAFVEAKSSQVPTSFPLDNITPTQWETALICNNLPYAEYYFAINDRRTPQHYRCWMVAGSDGIEALRDHSATLPGRHGNTIKWAAFDDLDTDLVWSIPRTFASLWDLTPWFNEVAGCNLPAIDERWIREREKSPKSDQKDEQVIL
jgi:hypothetical protein